MPDTNCVAPPWHPRLRAQRARSRPARGRIRHDRAGAYRPSQTPTTTEIRFVDRDTAIAAADYLSLHTRADASTRRIIDSDTLHAMKSTADPDQHRPRLIGRRARPRGRAAGPGRSPGPQSMSSTSNRCPPTARCAASTTCSSPRTSQAKPSRPAHAPDSPPRTRFSQSSTVASPATPSTAPRHRTTERNLTHAHAFRQDPPHRRHPRRRHRHRSRSRGPARARRRRIALST